MALQFEARKVALKQDRTGFILTLSLHPDELPVELIRDFVGTRYACAIVRIQDDESPTNYVNRVKQAAILCKAKVFQDFMDTDSEDETAEALCRHCGIESRTELNGNAKAQKLFDDLIKTYEAANDDF